MAENQDLGSTDTGIKPNVAALLSYFLGFVSGLWPWKQKPWLENQILDFFRMEG